MKKFLPISPCFTFFDPRNVVALRSVMSLSVGGGTRQTQAKPRQMQPVSAFVVLGHTGCKRKGSACKHLRVGVPHEQLMSCVGGARIDAAQGNRRTASGHGHSALTSTPSNLLLPVFSRSDYRSIGEQPHDESTLGIGDRLCSGFPWDVSVRADDATDRPTDAGCSSERSLPYLTLVPLRASKNQWGVRGASSSPSLPPSTSCTLSYSTVT